MKYFLKLKQDEEYFVSEMINKKIIKGIDEQTCSKCDEKVTLRIRIKDDKKFFYCRCVKCRTETSLFKDSFFSFDLNVHSTIKLPFYKVLDFVFYYFEQKTYVVLNHSLQL